MILFWCMIRMKLKIVVVVMVFVFVFVFVLYYINIGCNLMVEIKGWVGLFLVKYFNNEWEDGSYEYLIWMVEIYFVLNLLFVVK